MPIRFRCHQCTRLLGIAKRKAGTPIRCPQCGEQLTVPLEDEPGGDRTLQDLDDLLHPNPTANGASSPTMMPSPEPARPAVAMDLHRPVIASKPKPGAAAPKTRPLADDPLFEQENVDVLLGLAQPDEALDLDEAVPKVKPVSGLDAMSLDETPAKIVLSPRKATILIIAAIVLVAVAFFGGFLIGSN